MKKHAGAALCSALLVAGQNALASEASPSAQLNLLNRLVQENIVGTESSRLMINPIPVRPPPQEQPEPAFADVPPPAAPADADSPQFARLASQLNDANDRVAELTRALDEASSRNEAFNDTLAQKQALESELAALRAAPGNQSNDAVLAADLARAGTEIAGLKKQIADLQAQKPAPAKSDAGTAPRVTINDAATRDVRASYAVGAWYGESAPQETKKFASIGRKLDMGAFAQGFNDKLNNRMQLSQAKLDAELAGVEQSLSTAMLSENPKQSRAIIEKAAKEKGAVRTPDGAVYRILDSGKQPVVTDKNEILFELSEELGTGEVLASAERQSSSVKELPPLFQTVVKKLGVGGSVKLYIPGEQVYGESGVPGVVPPGVLAIMTIKVLGIK